MARENDDKAIWPKFCRHPVAQGLHVTVTLIGVPLILGAIVWAATEFVAMRDAFMSSSLRMAGIENKIEAHDRRIESLEQWARR